MAFNLIASATTLSSIRNSLQIKNAAVPLANASVFWDAATAVVLSQLGSVPLDSATKALLAAFLTGLAAPTTVGGTLGLLNPETATFSPVASSSVQDIGRLRPTKTTTYELGYTGLVADKLDVRLDVFYTEVKDFISPLQIVTPNVFLDQAATQAYVQPQMKAALMAQGMSEAEAEATATAYASIIAAAYAQVPIGTVTPSNSPYATDVMLTSRNYGNMSYYGFDLGLGYNVNTEWSIYGSASVINKNYFTAEELGGISPYSLNAPKYKSSLGVKYSNNDAHLSAGLQWRWVDGFSMNSGVYVGSVQAYNLVDMNARYSLPMVEGLSVTLTVTNLLNMPVQQFVGAPNIGRLAQVRVAFTF